MTRLIAVSPNVLFSSDVIGSGQLPVADTEPAYSGLAKVAAAPSPPDETPDTEQTELF